MAFCYQESPGSGALKQGEVLRNVRELRLLSQDPVQYRALKHPLTVVATADCDLYHDFRSRRNSEENDRDEAAKRSDRAKLVPYAVLCHLHEESDLRPEVPMQGTENWRRIKANKEARYHCLPAAVIGESGANLPALFIDFKQFLAIGPELLYAGIGSRQIERVAVIPCPYLELLAQRFFGFLGRVSLPD